MKVIVQKRSGLTQQHCPEKICDHFDQFNGLILGCTKDPVGKGISDAMTEQGLVKGALWIFPADSKKRKRPTNEEGDSVPGSGPGDT